VEPPLIKQPRLSVQELFNYTYDFSDHAKASFPLLALLGLSNTTMTDL
jgi:hypothetical protein